MLSYLKMNWASALVLFAGLYCGYLYITCANLENKLVVEKLQVSQLSQQVAEQNSSIAQWKAAGAASEKKLRDAEREAAKRASESRKAANEIMNEVVSDDCEKVRQYLISMASRVS